MSHSLSSLNSFISLLSSLSQVVRLLWATDGCCPAIVGHRGLWFEGRGLGLMVVGGGSNGSMVGDCGPMGMGHGSDGRGFGSSRS